MLAELKTFIGGWGCVCKKWGSLPISVSQLCLWSQDPLEDERMGEGESKVSSPPSLSLRRRYLHTMEEYNVVLKDTVKLPVDDY